MPKRTVVALVLIISLLGACGIALYYHYIGTYYVITEDARVAADTATVTPEISGKLLEWNVEEGDLVKAGQVLGRQDLASVMTSGAVSPQTMGAVAGVMAEKAVIKAPISGQVIQSKAVVGQMVAPGTQLAVIADIDNLYISANIKETVIERVKPGQLVDVHIDAYPGRKFRGRVINVGRATTSTFSLLPSQNSNGNFTKVTQVVPVKIQLEDASDADLMVGMSVKVRIHVR